MLGIAGILYLLLVLPGPLSLIYIPGKLIVRGDDDATANKEGIAVRLSFQRP